jgi:uncharacterized iron-regulated protein
MLDTGQQAAVDAALKETPRSPEAVSEAVTWQKSGWPDFALYRPVFAAGLAGGMRIVAANLPRDQVKALVKTGPAALTPAVRERLEREGPFPDDVRDVLRKEMSESHCGELPASMLDPLILAQRARDVQMAEALLGADDDGRGAVLVAGAGHVRTDWGIGALLARASPSRKVVSVAMIEAGEGLRTPQDYARELGVARPPFDYMVFTPRAEREDQCEKLRQHQKKVRAAEQKKAESDKAGTGAPASSGPAPGAGAPAASGGM